MKEIRRVYILDQRFRFRPDFPESDVFMRGSTLWKCLCLYKLCAIYESIKSIVFSIPIRVTRGK